MRIAINGCGIAGPALAWWLGHHGFTPVVFEKAPALRTGGHVIDLWGSGYTVTERMGLLPQLIRDGYIMEQLTEVGPTGKVVARVNVRVFQEVTGGRYLSIRRSDLSARLTDACSAHEIRFGCPITGLAQDETGVTVETARGTERFDLVIGADGLHSAIRGLAFGPEDRFERKVGLTVAAFTLHDYRPRNELRLFQHTEPNRQVSRLTLRDDQTLILCVFADRLMGAWPEGPAERKAAVARVIEGMGWEAPAIRKALEQVDEIYLDRASQIRMPAWSEGRVALIGDAAACPSLLAGEGAGLALTSAYVLAGELTRAGGDVAAAFAAWQGRMQPYVRRKQDQALKFSGFFAPKNRRGLWLRNMAMRLTAVPGLAKPLLGAGLTQTMDLPDYAPAVTSAR